MNYRSTQPVSMPVGVAERCLRQKICSDPYLNRFSQPDTDVPASQGTQGYDRYAYLRREVACSIVLT